MFPSMRLKQLDSRVKQYTRREINTIPLKVSLFGSNEAPTDSTKVDLTMRSTEPPLISHRSEALAASRSQIIRCLTVYQESTNLPSMSILEF